MLRILFAEPRLQVVRQFQSQARVDHQARINKGLRYEVRMLAVIWEYGGVRDQDSTNRFLPLLY